MLDAAASELAGDTTVHPVVAGDTHLVLAEAFGSLGDYEKAKKHARLSELIVREGQDVLEHSRAKVQPVLGLDGALESMLISAYLDASSSVVKWKRMPRSRIGRPYLASPIWRYGESSVALTGLPCG